MKQKRILKTAALAVVTTILFAIFAYRAAEWSKGFHSQMIVLGQGTFTGNPCFTGGATTTTQTLEVIPQVAIGSFDGGLTKYSTIIQIVNTSGMAQDVTVNFFRENGAALDNVTLTTDTLTVTSGTLSTTIQADAVLVITGTGTAATGVLGSARVTACANLTVSAFFELRDGTTNTLLSRVSVAASPANITSFVVPRIRDVSVGLDVGVALVNTSTTGITVTADLRDVNGLRIKMVTFSMGPGTHTAAFLKDIFAPITDPTGRTFQYVKFTANSPSLAATALAIEGATQTSVPVQVLQ